MPDRGLLFEWDDAKARSNLKKHGVDFREALTVFGDDLSQILPDEMHSDIEDRSLLVGSSTTGRLLVVSFTEPSDRVIRLLSARKATRSERLAYEG